MSNMTETQTYEDETLADKALDAVGDALDAHHGQWFTPSEIARKARVTTREAQRSLVWLEAHTMAVGDGNGCWRKWRAREWGEV